MLKKVRQRRSRIAQRLNVEEEFSEIGSTGGDFPFAKVHSKGERPTRSAVTYLLGSSLAAALLNSLFEQPAAALT